jgi:hypothetical protein
VRSGIVPGRPVRIPPVADSIRETSYSTAGEVATILEGGSEAKETNVQQRNTLQEQNMALMRRFSEARANKDPEAIMGCLTEDVVWRHRGRLLV